MNTFAEYQNFNKGGLIILAFLIATGFAIFFSILPSQVSPTTSIAAVVPIPEIQYQDHAVERHGADALAIRECLNEKGGADEIWRSPDKKTFYLWCQLPDGRWGFMAIIQDAIDRLWYESTSFVKGDGSRKVLMDYMSKWGTKFTGPFPW